MDLKMERICLCRSQMPMKIEKLVLYVAMFWILRPTTVKIWSSYTKLHFFGFDNFRVETTQTNKNFLTPINKKFTTYVVLSNPTTTEYKALACLVKDPISSHVEILISRHDNIYLQPPKSTLVHEVSPHTVVECID